MSKRSMRTHTSVLHEALESRRFFSIDNGATSLDIGGTHYFVNSDSQHGMELWKSNLDGTNKQLVKDVWAKSSKPHGFMEFNGKLVFLAHTDKRDNQLFISDGTE